MTPSMMTKQSGNYSFSTRDNKAMLRAINKYIPGDRLVHSPNFFDVAKAGIRGLFHR